MRKTIFTIAMLCIAINSTAQTSEIKEENGNVGVGTTNPSEKFEVYNSVTKPGIISLRSSRNDAQNVDVGRVVAKQGTTEVSRIGMPRAGGTNTGYLTFWTKETNTSALKESVRINEKGNVGIGKTTPTEKLHIEGNLLIDAFEKGNESGIFFREGFSQSNKYNLSILAYNHNGSSADGLSINGFDGISFSTGAGTRNERMRIKQNGNVGIGTIETGKHRLAVEGSIGAREIKVEATGWSDFVFENEYELPTLKEVEKHIKEKGHLKDIPSEAEVLKNGFYLGEMDSKLLQKIEELTLYTIQQEKQLKEQAKNIKRLEALVEKLIENKKQNTAK
ncbi:hypothetical protein [uncultured Tenacibaculum sp.]|uniref:hypothetical protein n=1 Tax=uncultured Tenacibaculum sp. TaxID=174713 RepID=UPI00263787E5|nr:hypothetical protein [uncultured Tenacibaculum sp.]